MSAAVTANGYKWVESSHGAIVVSHLLMDLMDAHSNEHLQQIFGAYVRQETLEVAAVEMADVSRAYPDLHDSFFKTLTTGIEAARAGDPDACAAVEKSGYFASSAADAESIIAELFRLYVAKRDKK